ncbi:AraC family transcriptional regulator [Rhizobium sp. BK399]|uniref:helix-turn-helix domain-containing protein n=1 Tax=Rhizobium sp. BK399 TaxID=2587063 RepID=UPI001612904D|nr:AraC family transcriptional regulator [Rhizobium sp. BK399]MBB3543046.1 AraC-like DNA-binding protein [Rhizobium sp. BK399]
MRSQGIYGRSLGDHFHLNDAPAIVTKTLKRSEVAVTHIKCRKPSLTSSIPTEDAYLVAYQIEDCIEHELWINGKGTGRLPFFGGQTSFYDLREDPMSFIGETSNCMMYYLPKSALDTIAEEHGKRFGELQMRSDKPADDPVIAALSATLMPAFANPEYASQLFLDHTTLAVANHIAHRYGSLHAITKAVTGGLTAKNEKRAKEIIEANITGEISLSDLAFQCGLSARHFARAFKQSVGVAPHHWLVMRRCERAKDLLQWSALTLADIALACGFADQSHFTRAFSRVVGISPGAWRRLS